MTIAMTKVTTKTTCEGTMNSEYVFKIVKCLIFLQTPFYFQKYRIAKIQKFNLLVESA